MMASFARRAESDYIHESHNDSAVLYGHSRLLQGIAKRAYDRLSSHAHDIEFGNRAPVLAQIGWQFAQRVDS